MVQDHQYINKIKMNKETIEEAAKRHATNHGMMSYVFPEKKESFIAGAEWMKEQMEILKDFDTWKEWINKPENK